MSQVTQHKERRVQQKRGKTLFRISVTFLLGLLVIADSVYLALGRFVIRAMYEGKSVLVLNRLIQERAEFVKRSIHT